MADISKLEDLKSGDSFGIDNLKIQSDTRGYLRLFRSNTFDDPYVFIVEALQNAQRAEATEVKVTVTNQKITISDNGPGLSNPEDLFTIARTGWDAEITKRQDPFGLGFFSIFALGDTVEVRSKNKVFRVNYPKLLESKDLEVDVEILEEEYQGFEVTISDLVPEYTKGKAITVVEDTCKTIRNIKSTINDRDIKTVDYMIPPTDKPYSEVNTPGASGWISLNTYYWEGEISIYHCDRFVTKITSLGGFNGAISIELSALNLRVPDRRAVVKDQKYDEFIAYLKADPVKKLLLEALKDSKIGPYQEELLERHLESTDYAEFLHYTVLDKDSVDGIMTKVSSMGESDLQHMSEKDFDQLFKEKIEESTLLTEKIEWSSSHSNSFSPPSEENYSYSPPSILDQVKSLEDDLPKTKIDFKDLSKQRTKSTIYYAEPKDIKLHSEIIEKLVEFGLTIVITRTKLEVKALQELLGALYIGDSSIRVQQDYSILPRKDTLKSRRVSALVTIILRLLGKKDIDIKIGKISKSIITYADESIVDKELENPIFNLESSTLVIDSDSIKCSRIMNSSDPRMDIGELFFLLSNVNELAETLGVSVSRLCSMIPKLPVSWIVTNRIDKEETDDNGLDEEIDIK